MDTRRLNRFGLSALSLVVCVSSAGARAQSSDTGWETVLSDRNRQVQIDRSSIIPSDGGNKVAWGRVVLTPAQAAKAGYTTIQALNRYDCINRSFITVKRRYLDARNIVVREDNVDDQKATLVVRNSVDERLWNEVCKPPSMADLSEIADRAGQAALALGMQPADAGGASGEGTDVQVPDQGVPVIERSAPLHTDVAERRSAQVRDASPVLTAPAPAPASALAVPLPVAPRGEVRTAPVAPIGAARPAPKARPVAPAGLPPAAPQWSYEGATGPEHWGTLRPEWALCASGRQQSPVALVDGIAVDLEPIAFEYRVARYRIVDAGTTLQVHVADGMGAQIRGRRYELTHFQFHRPPEHPFAGSPQAMAVHFHHRADDGRIAIVAVPLERSNEPHPQLQRLLNSLPLEKGGEYAPADPIDLASLLSGDYRHYLYMGSLTTPPCTEGVLWVVMKEPVGVSAEQLNIFDRLYPSNGRPLQPAHDRLILESH